ncbi:MAG: hypothetical protein ACI9KK_001413 [Ascidiaceihabitans sp.]
METILVLVRQQELTMSIISNQDQFVTAQIIELVSTERAKALSKREWKHRLAGYGYGIRETDAGDVLETLPHHVEVCTLPAKLSA